MTELRSEPIDFGFTGVGASVPYASLSCNANCTANVSQCPGTVTPFDPSSFDTAQETSITWTQVEVIDSLGRVEGPGALFGGQSSHQLWAFFEHVSGDAWTLWFYGRGEEYQGGVAGTPHLIDSLALVFSGPDLLTVDGNPAMDPISITLGGVATGPFTPGADSSVAPQVTLQIRLSNLKRENWTTFWNATGWSRVTQALVSAGEPGTPDELQLGICASDLYCTGWNSLTGRFESTAATIYDADPSNPRSDWEVMFQTFMNVAAHNPAGFSITALPEGVFPTEVTPAACSAGSIALNDLTTSPDQVFMVLDRSGSMRETTKIPDFNQDGKTRLEYVQAAARAYVTLVHGQPVDQRTRCLHGGRAL